MTTNTTTGPRIYVACLASYNAGRLHGRWIDCTTEDIEGAIEAMLKASPAPGAEEWAIHDHEGWHGLDPSSLPQGELGEWAEALEEHGGAFVAYVRHVGESYCASAGAQTTREAFDSSYMGEWTSQEAWAWEDIESHGRLNAMPEDLRGYFDIEAYARDLFINEYFSAEAGPGDAVWVFASR